MDIKPRFRIPTAFLAVCMVLASFGVGIAVGVARSTVFGANGPMLLNGGSASAPEGVDLANFWTVWNLLNEKFVATATTTPATEEEKLWGAMQGLASSYGDPYTVFMPPVEAKGFAETVSGSFSGVGMEIGIKDKILTVIAPLKNSPAEKAGMLAGDKILAINGEPTDGLSVDEAVSKIRGESGTKVKLLVLHGGDEPKEVEITRAPIEVPVVETTNRPDGVFVIAIYSFSAPSVDRFRDALREFITTGGDRLIIDVRGNPGGYLGAAVDIASYFLPLGETVVTEDYAGKQTNEVHHSRGYNVFKASGRNVKVAVLINGGSASASEILAGALHDQGIATLIGEKSFGKGSVQELINLAGGASLKVTVAHWLTPKGTSISKQGITPDVEVKLSEEDIKNKHDAQMEAAAAYLLKK